MILPRTCIWTMPLAAVLIVSVPTGCSPPARHETLVTGSVSLDGRPIEYGSVVFHPATPDGQDGGGLIEEGRYSAKVPPGRKIVRVCGMKPAGMGPPAEGDTSGEGIRLYEQITLNENHWDGSEFIVDVGERPMSIDLRLSRHDVLKNDDY